MNDMDNIWKVEINADDCPVQMWDGNCTIDMKADYINNELWESLTGQSRYRVHKLSVGETVYIAYTNTVYKLGDKYGDSPLVCTKIIYKPRKWWQKLMFWKKKEIIGYIFTVIE